jgi:hypothetical protein
MAFVLEQEIKALARKFGLENLGFLTLTFADHVTELKEAQRRFKSICTNVLTHRYRRCIGVWERQNSGRLHFHLVVVLNADIRTGFDFEALKRRDYRSASTALRSEWAFWRKTAPAYRFGRTELLPVKSNADGIACYVGKYITKHVYCRNSADVGARVIRFIGYKSGDRVASSRLGWSTDKARRWRSKLAVWAAANHFPDMDSVRRRFGPRWAYLCRNSICNFDLDLRASASLILVRAEL